MTVRGRAILIATSNEGKRQEYLELLPREITVLSMRDVAVQLPPETADTFAGNARIKAAAAASKSGHLVLADDSGLEVDDLGGAPGVFSARYAGEPPDDRRNIAHLLAQLIGVPAAQRTARFHCAIALADRTGVIAEGHGTCEGMIAAAPAGHHGFGYDPVFLLPDGRTMAELESSEKNRISHRAVAFRTILSQVLETLDQTISEVDQR